MRLPGRRQKSISGHIPDPIGATESDQLLYFAQQLSNNRTTSADIEGLERGIFLPRPPSAAPWAKAWTHCSRESTSHRPHHPLIQRVAGPAKFHLIRLIPTPSRLARR